MGADGNSTGSRSDGGRGWLAIGEGERVMEKGGSMLMEILRQAEGRMSMRRPHKVEVSG